MAEARGGYFATGKISVPGPAKGSELVTIVEDISEETARAGAVALLEAGIGAHVVAPGAGEGGEAGGWGLQVVGVDVARAIEILGLPQPEVGSAAQVAVAGLEAKAARPTWVRIVLIFVVAIIVLPLTAYFVTYKAMGGDCPTGPDVPVSVILNEPC